MTIQIDRRAAGADLSGFGITECCFSEGDCLWPFRSIVISQSLYDEYDSNKWTPSYIYFQDMPSIKMSINVSDDDLSLLDNNIVDVFYNLENVSP